MHDNSQHSHKHFGRLPDAPRPSRVTLRCATCNSICDHVEVLTVHGCKEHGAHYTSFHACTECQMDLIAPGKDNTHLMVPVFDQLLG